MKPFPDMDFGEFHERMMALYNSNHYAAALELVEWGKSRYTEQQNRFPFWRACLLALLNRPGEAVDALESGLAEGAWWGEPMLRHDADLTSLQGNPRFEAVVDRCREHWHNAQKTSQPGRRLILPASGGMGAPLLVVLHGWGGNADQNAELWGSAEKSGWVVALLQSSQICAPNGYCWDDKALAGEEITRQVMEICAETGCNAGRIVIGGISQGGGMCIRVAFQKRIPVCGFLAAAPALMSVDELEVSARAVSPRGVVIIGSADKRWWDAAHQITTFLEQHSLPHRLEEYAGLGHSLPHDFRKRLPEWLEFLSGGQD